MRYAIKKPLWPYVLDVQSPQAQDLVGWWSGDPSGGGKLFDLSGLGKNGTLTNFGFTNNSGWAAGQDGGSCLVFDGTNDFVTMPNSASVQGLSAATISLWYYPIAVPATNSAGIWYESTTVAGFSRFAMFHASNGDLISGMRDTDSGSVFVITSTSPFTLLRWHHLAMTVDAASDNLIIYLNGRRLGINSTAKGPFTTGNPADTLAIGSFTLPASERYINGRIETAILHRRALSPAEVWSLYDPATRWSLRYQTGKTKYFFGINPLISFDSAGNSGYTAATSSFSGSASWNGSNRMLAVDVSMLGPGVTVTAMTYGGANCTFIGGQSTVTSFGRVESWRIIQADSGAPAAGSNTLSVTLSGSVAFAVNWVAYTGVHQTTPIEAFNSAQATNVGAADATVSITTVAVNDWVHGAVATDDASVTANQTTRNNVTGAGGSGADEDTGPIASPGATAISYANVGALATWAIAGYAIRPTTAASLGGGPFPYFRRANELTGGFFGMGL